MKNIIDLLNKGLGVKAIAKQLNTTEWQVRLIKKQLNADKPEKKKLEPVKVHNPAKGKKSKTYIFTSWEIRTDPSEEFIDILRQMQKRYNAELFLVPVWPDDLKYLPPKLQEFKIVTSDFEINQNILFKYVPTHALAVSPLAGWKGAFTDRSVIIPGLIKEMITEPSNHLAKQAMTTGSVGRLNPDISNYKHLDDYADQDRAMFNRRWAHVYNRRLGRAYAIAQEYVVPSALVVDILDSKTFLTRFVSMPTDGVVYDQNLKFIAGKSEPKVSNPSALVMGDAHVWQGDKVAWDATLAMLKYLNPKSLVLNDFFDGLSVNHHEVDDAAVFYESPSIEEEAALTKEKLIEISKYAKKVYYLASNHDDFIVKYIRNEDNYRLNYNYAICLETRAAQIRSKQHPIIDLLDMGSIKNLAYVREDANLKIDGTTVIHGHQTISGRRVGFRGLAQIYNRVIMGHLHSPAVYRNASMVGTTSKLLMNYNKGVSNWLHCNGLIHEDGSTQLLPIIDGRWKL